MKVVVLGAGGQLGAVMATVARSAGHDVIAWTRSEADITNARAITAQLTASRPEVIFNCAAWASVDAAEDAPTEALAANATALRTLAAVANNVNATLVHYSTDFVFDGREAGDNTEERAANPRGVYATSKLIGEWFAAESRSHYVLRVESLFGGRAAKSSVDKILDNLMAGEAVRAFADRTVTPSYVVDVAHASLAAATRRIPDGVYHCVNSGTTNWLELTKELASIASTPTPDIVPVNMADLNMRVSRPLNAAMSNAKLAAAGINMPNWRDALRRYVEARLQRAHR